MEVSVLMERVVIKFTKENEAKFISHLDTMRTLHRAMRRAQIPIAYSKGFNPHPSISVAAPLSLGFSSAAEYADVELNQHMPAKELIEKLNDSLPDGMRVKDAFNITEKMPAAMALVDVGLYKVGIKHRGNLEGINKVIQNILGSNEIIKLKKTKSGEKNVDIRPLIRDISVSEFNKDSVVFSCILLTGSKGTLSPELFADVLRDYSNGMLYGYASIFREKLFTEKNGSMMELDFFFKGK